MQLVVSALRMLTSYTKRDKNQLCTIPTQSMQYIQMVACSPRSVEWRHTEAFDFWCDVMGYKLFSQFCMRGSDPPQTSTVFFSHRGDGGCRAVSTYPGDYSSFHSPQLKKKTFVVPLVSTCFQNR